MAQGSRTRARTIVGTTLAVALSLIACGDALPQADTPQPPAPDRGAATQKARLGEQSRESARLEAAAEASPPSSVRDMRLLTASQGWVLTDRRLARTDDSGESWRDIAPPDVPAEDIHGVYFLDPSHGWLARLAQGESSLERGARLEILRTEDGGRTWSGAPLPSDIAAYGGHFYLHYVDNRVG